MAQWPRRSLLQAAAAVLGSLFRPKAALAAPAADPVWQLSDEQWRERLSAEAFRVLRQEGTEPPFSSPLKNEKRKGTFTGD